MGSNRRMDHMTWPEFKEAKTRPVIVPIGSTEQHGQHLPIGTDAVLATRVAEDLAERIDGTVIPCSLAAFIILSSTSVKLET